MQEREKTFYLLGVSSSSQSITCFTVAINSCTRSKLNPNCLAIASSDEERSPSEWGTPLGGRPEDIRTVEEEHEKGPGWSSRESLQAVCGCPVSGSVPLPIL